jgi:hypothetical protein
LANPLSPSEKAIQDATIANLHLVGCIDVREDRDFVTDLGLGARMNVGTAIARDEHGRTTRSVDFGFTGLSDYIVIIPVVGRFCPIEFKNANGRLRPAQKRFLDRCARLGAPGILGRSVGSVSV